MIRTVLALACVLFSLNTALGQGTLKPETLDKLKKATAYVRIDTARATASGSGFLLGKVADQGFIATNSHVVAAAKGGGGLPIKVVFNSGMKDELELAAEIVGDDPDRDLALLAVRSDKLPVFINSSKAVELTETLPVYVLGFPFGEALATSGRNPAITVSKGEISSIRRGAFDRIAAIQIDGGINPGNSGGPVVTTDGDLVGISVAKVIGTEIGFAIPARELRDMLLGRLANVRFEETSRTKSSVTYTVKGNVIDPLRRMQNVSVLFIAKSKVSSEPKPSDAGEWSKISSLAKSLQMKVEGQEFQGEVTLDAGKSGEEIYWMQPTFVRSDNKLIYAQPSDFVVKGDATTALASSSRPTRPTPGSKPDDGLGKLPLAGKPALADDDALFGKVDVKPQTVSEELAGARQKVDGADDIFLTPVKLAAEKLLKTIVYSKDGKHAFLVTADGVLHKVTVPGLVEEARLELGTCGALSMSKAGLVAALSATQRLLVLDEETLAIKKQVRVGGATWVTASSETNIGFACSNWHRSETLSIVDLARGVVVDQIQARSLGRARVTSSARGGPLPVTDFAFPTLTPDGKYLFFCSFECLHRVEVKGTSLTLAESGPRIGQNAQGMEISIDSKYVALPSGGGNYAVEGHPSVGYGTYIYSVEDLQTPRIGIKTGAYPRLIALDPIAKLIYAQNHDSQLLVVNTSGIEEGKYILAKGSRDPLEFALHPLGKQMFVLFESSLFWVEIARE